MSGDGTANALQTECNVGATTKSVAAPEQPGKGRRTRRVSTKGVSKVPNTPGRRSSIYRGVTRHRWTGRYEAHLWDKSCWSQSQNKKGRQVYLGAYDDEEAAARAYDLAALKYWGPGTTINFPVMDYTKELEEMIDLSKEEYLASLRRKSSGFSRGASKYRGVARHHHNGRWEARIGRIFGNKYLYLGTYSTQEEAAAAYDMAAIEYRGLNAVTNFDLSRYISWLRPGQAGSALLNPTDTNGVSEPQAQDSFVNIPGQCSTLSIEGQIGHSGMWPASQTCEKAYSQLTSSSSQVTNSSGSALAVLLQSGIFKQMLDKAAVMDGRSDHLLEDQTSYQSHCDQVQFDPDQMGSTSSNGDLKHELVFHVEQGDAFDCSEMSLMDQSEEMPFQASSNLDQMFFQSDMSFPYLPTNACSTDMVHQGANPMDSAPSPSNSLTSLYSESQAG